MFFFPSFYNGSNSDLFKFGRAPGLLRNVVNRKNITGDCALCHMFPDPRKDFTGKSADKGWKASRGAWRLSCMRAAISRVLKFFNLEPEADPMQASSGLLAECYPLHPHAGVGQIIEEQ